MTAQAGKIYRYFRADADKNISGDVVEFSTDETTWVAGTYIATGSLPARPAAVDTANPPLTGLTGYWFQVLTGPGTSLPLVRGDEQMYARATDSPEIPHFAWSFPVLWSD